MPPKKDDRRSQATNLNDLKSQIILGKPVKERKDALEELISFFRNPAFSHWHDNLKNKEYHGLFEALFKAALDDKGAFLNGKGGKKASNAAAERLMACGKALREIVTHGISKLRPNTVRAVIDHIMDTLPDRHDEFFEPLAPDYMQTLVVIFRSPVYVESLAFQVFQQPEEIDVEDPNENGWIVSMDFFIRRISHLLDGADTSSVSGLVGRDSPTPGAARHSSVGPSSARPRLLSQHGSGQVQRNDLLAPLECLLSLVSASNAPCKLRSQEVSDVVLRILRLRLKLDRLHRIAFAILNRILLQTAGEDVNLGLSQTRELVPILSYWWQPRALDNDQLLFAVRDEILKTIHAIHLFLDSLLQDHSSAALLIHVEDLMDDVLWGEYSQRNHRSRLRLDDLTFSSLSSSSKQFSTNVFAIRPFAQDAERRWALLEVMSRLECIFLRHTRGTAQRPTTEEEQPRKKQRIAGGSDRIHQKLLSSDVAIRLTALQLIPFFLPLSSPDEEEIISVMEDLMPMIGDKQGLLSSWAMIACASCAFGSQATNEFTQARWKQVWQLAVRSVSIPSTCRAACVLLHAIIEARLIPYHAIADDVDKIVTMADVCGPAVLVDSSLIFMHSLASIRNSMVPSASQKTSSHVIRWVFTTWKPAESAYASSVALSMIPIDLVNLFLSCCGLPAFEIPTQLAIVGGTIIQFWNSFDDFIPMIRYLLLLKDDKTSQPSHQGQVNSSHADSNGDFSENVETSSSQTSKTLVLELLYPKLVDLFELLGPASQPGTRREGEGTGQLSTERLQSFLTCLISATILLSHLEVSGLRAENDIKSTLENLWDRCFQMILDSPVREESFKLVLTLIGPYIPSLDSTRVHQFCIKNPDLLRLFSRLSDMFHNQDNRHISTHDIDAMDVDDDFESRSSQGQPTTKSPGVPRQKFALILSPEAFYESTKMKLYLFSEFFKNPGQIGLVPEALVDKFLSLGDEQFLLCSEFLRELLRSDFGNISKYAQDIVEQMGTMLAEGQFKSCEVFLCLLIDVLLSFAPVWSMGDGDPELVNPCIDLYNFLVKTAWPENFMSPDVQIAYASLLLRLWEINARFHEDKKTRVLAPYQTLLSTSESLRNFPEETRDPRPGLVWEGSMSVRFYIAPRLTGIFEFFVVSTHEDIFVDILHALPNKPEDMEGIAFRISVLASLACKCPTLLRRGVWHTVEICGEVPDSAKYATHAMKTIALARSLESPQGLFQLFAPQLFYIWLLSDSVEDIPFRVFDFTTLDDLLKQSQTEASALMVMRGQDQALDDLAQRLQVRPGDMVEQGFSKIMAYSIAFDLSTYADSSVSAEFLIRSILGKERYLDLIYRNFADIIGNLFDIIDQEEPIEGWWRKDDTFAYAAEIMEEIKGCSHSPTVLPPSQQPLFKSKYLHRAISHLVRRTNHDVASLWTPALTTSVARRLLNTIHPSLGPLHALSVIRRVRILICLAGPQAACLYPLEMLLRSTRPFLANAECADDALGISQWLLDKGSPHLAQSPSFLAGYALSTLASLRMFLESSQASSTQESLFKSTMNKTQRFHAWFVELLKNYQSSTFKSETQSQSFNAIIHSASNIRSLGNSEKHTNESRLLLEILKDAEQEEQLLNESARELALRMLCGDFRVPRANRDDIIESDEDACSHGPMVWKSCRAVNSSKEYLTWAGRVVGRSFAASGEIPHDVLRESLLSTYQKTTGANGDSVHSLLRLTVKLTMSDRSSHAGRAESALRSIVSHAASTEDHDLITDCGRSIPETLYASSDWYQYQTPPTDHCETELPSNDVFRVDQIESSSWARDLCTYLARSVKGSIILQALASILSHVDGFAEQALSFLIHLVLLEDLNSQRTLMRSLSAAFKAWLESTSTTATDNIKLLINTVLYLRTRTFPNEISIADRSRWLELQPSTVADAATRCGMFKVALMFAELASSEPTRTTRRSSAARDIEDSSETLLKIFENIDDPDTYYGLNHTASLSNVLARLEYEKEGGKSLAFRGAQYDSHLRMGDSSSDRDGQSLVKILSGLGLSGLSNSLLQTHQHHDDDPNALDSTFITARRLEIWNLPAPPTLENHAAISYRTYQSIQRAIGTGPARDAVRDGLATTMGRLATKDFRVSDLRQHLGTLASLTELDDILGVIGFGELEKVLADFETRSKWMMSGRYDDVSQILSHRETTLSMLSQKDVLRSTSQLTSPEARLVEIRSMLLSSSIFRFHHARQESLNVSTRLTDLVSSSESIGLAVDAAVSMETANSLWDYGEMIPSIRLLQGLQGSFSSLKRQSIPVTHADLLSKIGYQISIAKLETADSIQKKYLEPALKELKGKSSGKEAGQVFHQFAVFCDEQLQNPDMLEDLARLQRLVQTKAEEVNHYKRSSKAAGNSQLKDKFDRYLKTAQKYLDLDQAELQRSQRTRNEFVKLSLENYLQSLSASDDHDNDALRFTALWLERSENDVANHAVLENLKNVPTRKFAPLMNQLSSRLQLDKSHFQSLLMNLVCRICLDHPYHGMYQIWSGTRSNPNAEDEVAVLRKDAANKVANEFERNIGVATIWSAIRNACASYHYLAKEKKDQYRTGAKIRIQDSKNAATLASCLARHKLPPPTLEIELRPDRDYSKAPVIVSLEPTMSVASGVSAPKIITVRASNGERYKQLVKSGNDDLRQDAIMEQVFAAVSSLLKQHRATRQRSLGIRTYKVLPLTARTGLIEFVANTVPLHDWLMPAHERYYPMDMKVSHCRKEISSVAGRTTDIRVSMYRKVTEKFHPVMRYFFLESFPDPDDWYVKRLAYTRTTAAISILGHVLGLGDRHGHNILLDQKTGEVVHIDLGVAFETGRILPVPEVVPFRMTRDIVDGMGVTKTDGVFRRCCEFTLDALREDTYSIMTVLDVLRYDPLYSWSSTPMRLAKLQGAARRAEGDDGNGNSNGEGEGGAADGGLENKKKGVVNEPSEADRALEVVRKKLSKTLSVTATVNDLINQATDERNLAVLYSGWAAYA
ncbi:Serine/threonine-protein kinase tel1 [Cytospora mali]|uniref:Serine/threonine-protein kinase Tel1 n=1 Tax=Cytospora mali TaxID=578113 RepID=A0A194UZ61_CYTMA|nr:Serine/threonine-protein kinase tel1 [Valsa mali var. pyri (nom. inval.)]